MELVNTFKWQWHPAPSVTLTAGNVTAIWWEQTCRLAEGTGRNGPKCPTLRCIRCHIVSLVSRSMCRAEFTSVLKLYQRADVPLFSISTGNGTQRLPLGQREGHLDVKRNDELQRALITKHLKHMPTNQSIYKYSLGAYSNKSCIMCQTLS